ncbi:thioredoxin family protein [Gimesia aquarii]|uniref:Thioredoxin n=1 Tax=Gimesia aquarii TaxID=2527964 RepID=A0A517VPN2_9PLAN|nr:thioredoxin family protein [Gimesia aquarii]QDT94977.1 Thioredoxin [Gimesia aquarii]
MNPRTHKTRFVILAVSILLVAKIVSADPIPFHKTLENAIQSDGKKRPVVVVFGAPWCGWCRKMDVDTFTDSRVEAISKKYLWVKVDIDEDKETAARFGVHGVPQTFVLNDQGSVLGSRGGYIPPQKMVNFITESLDNPHPSVLLPDLLKRYAVATTEEEIRDTTFKLVEQLARSDRVGREVILAAMKTKGASSWPVLLELMADERLSIRAAAVGSLKHMSKADIVFHPFAKHDLRQQQIAVWQQWLDNVVSVK